MAHFVGITFGRARSAMNTFAVARLTVEELDTVPADATAAAPGIITVSSGAR